MTDAPYLKKRRMVRCHLGLRLLAKARTLYSRVKSFWWLCKIGGLSWSAVGLIWDVSRQREAWQDGLINLVGCKGPQFGIRSGIDFGTVQSFVLRIAITERAISRLSRCGSARPICPVFRPDRPEIRGFHGQDWQLQARLRCHCGGSVSKWPRDLPPRQRRYRHSGPY